VTLGNKALLNDRAVVKHYSAWIPACAGRRVVGGGRCITPTFHSSAPAVILANADPLSGLGRSIWLLPPKVKNGFPSCGATVCPE